MKGYILELPKSESDLICNNRLNDEFAYFNISILLRSAAVIRVALTCCTLIQFWKTPFEFVNFCFSWANQPCPIGSDWAHQLRSAHRYKRVFQNFTDVCNRRTSNTKPGLRDTPIVKILRCQNGNFCILSHLCRIDWLSDRVIKIRSGFLT